jgi:hypothetical protein
MTRLIDADALKEVFKQHEDRKGYLHCDWEDFIDNAPTVEQPQGEWEKEELQISFDCSQTIFYCSQCHSEKWLRKFNYCPNCGAKMKQG